MLANVSSVVRWAVVVALLTTVTLVTASNSNATTEPETVINDYSFSYDDADFWFRSNVADATFECRLVVEPSDPPFEPCTSPAQYRDLPEGTYRFEVRAVDSAGVVDSSPANLGFTSVAEPPPTPPAPANDNFYGSESISGTSGSVQGTNMDATTQWDEPFNPEGSEHTVWYAWTAGRQATVTFTAVGSRFTPRVSIFSGPVAERAFMVSTGVGSASYRTYPGLEYHVSVDGVDGGMGTFTLSWAYEDVGPPNDYIAEAAALAGDTGSLSGTTAGATVEANEPRHDGTGGENLDGHSIWYRWTAPATGTAIFTTEGSSFDTQLAAYNGSDLGSLAIQGWYLPNLNPWTTWSRLELEVEAGEQYTLAVDGQDEASGDFQLNWRMAFDTGDTELPTVELWSPQPGDRVEGPVTFMADAFDNDSIDRVMYFIQPNDATGSPWLVGEAREWPFAVELDTSAFEPGVYSVDARAVDASGNSASYGFNITVGNVLLPTLVVPVDMTVEATGPNGALVQFTARATDSNGEPLPVTCSPRSRSVFRLGSTTVTCSATDDYGNWVADRFTVRVVDTTAPTLTTPGELVADAVSPAGAVLQYAATATDIVSGTLAPACTPASGSTFAIGDTMVTCEATDAAGNTGTSSFVVHVKGAAEQLGDVQGYIEGLAIEARLAERLRSHLADARKHLAEGRANAVCGGLFDFVGDVRKESGKRLTPEQAERLVADADRVRVVVGC